MCNCVHLWDLYQKQQQMPVLKRRCLWWMDISENIINMNVTDDSSKKIQQCCLGLLFQIAHNAPIWHQISILTSSYTPFLVALRRYWGDPFVMSLSENYWEYVTWIKNKTKQCFRWWDPTLGFPCRPASTRSRQRTSRTSAYLAMVVEMELIIWKMMNTESWKLVQRQVVK